MIKETQPVWKTWSKAMGEKAKDKAIEGKQRFEKWQERQRIKKYNENVKRKDQLANLIVFTKNEIAKTETKYEHLQSVSLTEVIVPIEGMDIPVSIETICAAYKTELHTLNKQKGKYIKAFLALENAIEEDKETAERIKEIKSEAVFAELIPLIVEIPHYIPKGKDFIVEDSFGTLEFRYDANGIECAFNGLIIHLRLDARGRLDEVNVVDWWHDKPIRLATGNHANITALNWAHRSPHAYENELADMQHTIQTVYKRYFNQESLA